MFTTHGRRNLRCNFADMNRFNSNEDGIRFVSNFDIVMRCIDAEFLEMLE
jgi:hypothetical protein